MTTGIVVALAALAVGFPGGFILGALMRDRRAEEDCITCIHDGIWQANRSAYQSHEPYEPCETERNEADNDAIGIG